jgi:undecaprenyl-diphosphatase
MNEVIIVQAINALGRGTAIDAISAFVSSRIFLGVLAALTFILIVKLDRKRGKEIAIALIIALAVFFVANELVIKDIGASYGLERMRPYILHPDIIPIGTLSTDSSFPSSHVAGLTAFAFVLACYYRRHWLYFTLAVLIMAFSRLHNGMHYPSDILGGIAFGIIYGFVAVKVSNFLFRKKQKK